MNTQPPLQKHIADSLERFEKTFCNETYGEKPFLDNGYYSSPDEDLHIKIQNFFKAEQLQLLEIARGEVEKMQCLADEQDNLVVRYVKRQDVLDTLTITNLTKE